jgi:hypothetical protein
VAASFDPNREGRCTEMLILSLVSLFNKKQCFASVWAVETIGLTQVCGRRRRAWGDFLIGPFLGSHQPWGDPQTGSCHLDARY